MRTLLIVAGCAVAIPVLAYLFWTVHCALDRVCVRHARKYCERHGLEIRRVRWQPAFETVANKSVKTEFTLVELDCFDGRKERRLILLAVWPFGVRQLVSDEKYPELYDEQWPQKH